MSNKRMTPDRPKEKKEQASRHRRRAAQLRENLLKRKAQARLRRPDNGAET